MYKYSLSRNLSLPAENEEVKLSPVSLKELEVKNCSHIWECGYLVFWSKLFLSLYGFIKNLFPNNSWIFGNSTLSYNLILKFWLIINKTVLIALKSEEFDTRSGLWHKKTVTKGILNLEANLNYCVLGFVTDLNKFSLWCLFY